MNNEQLKEKVKSYWNQASCGTEFIKEAKHSLSYFEAIEDFRYSVEPEIFSFAQFSRFHKKTILEVGVGAGTDFTQWLRCGARAHGIDLTLEAVANVNARLSLYGLKAESIQVGDAENLPHADNFFDLVYSWGVIHHSPDTPKCLSEIVRVTKPGGKIKIMIYNRHSLFAFYRYLLSGLFKGKPFRSLKEILFFDQESPGTKAYTFKEAKQIIAQQPVKTLEIKATVSQHDLLYYKNKFLQRCAYIAACCLGWNKVGWFMTIELEKL
jgi:ubiquinone/menaquinone biosynthesis C-methylase UbiE